MDDSMGRIVIADRRSGLANRRVSILLLAAVSAALLSRAAGVFIDAASAVTGVVAGTAMAQQCGRGG